MGASAREQTTRLGGAPGRIVSLVPSTTDTVCALGAADRLVGRTAFCVHPAEQLREVRVVGGTKTPNLRRVGEQRPDLVLMNVEENRVEHVAAIEQFAPVFAALPKTVEDAIADLRVIGGLLAVPERGEQIAGELENALDDLRARAQPYSYAYVIWRDPYMTINDDTFIADLLGAGGGTNVFGGSAERYPCVTLEAIAAAEPDLILMPDEPYAFGEQHVEEIVVSGAFPGGRRPNIRLVRGDLLSWHGARLREGIPYSGALTRSG